MNEQYEALISVQDLHYGYQPKQPVLNQLNLMVPQGSIYGFLGANGAGKSTTIRTILGLLHPQQGKVQLFGQDLQEDRQGLLQKVGSLIESPSIYRHLSAYDNLRLVANYWGLTKARIDEVLEQVNLYDHRHKLSRKYSTGMKQRLGLAMALMHDPDLLILDEPTSGLDPTGIIEIRNIIQRLNQAGKTIFLSSHLLTEIEKIATQVGIIKSGQLLFEGSINELEQLRQKNQTTYLAVSDARKAQQLLATYGELELIDDQHLRIQYKSQEQIPNLAKLLVEAGLEVQEIRTERNDLEKLFIDLTQ